MTQTGRVLIVDAVGPEWTRVEVLDVAGVLPRKWYGDPARCLEATLSDRRLLRDMQPGERQTLQVTECACFHHTYGPFRQIAWSGLAYRCAQPGTWIQFVAPSDRGRTRVS